MRGLAAPATGEAADADAAQAGGHVGDGDLPTRLLVFGVARQDGSIAAADVFAVAGACRRAPEQVRSCLRRLVSEGLFEREGVGRRAVYRPTDRGLRALRTFGARTRRAHALDAAASGWDGRWHLVGFAVPESRRTARDALRDHLVRLGGAAVHNGLYVSPLPWDGDVLATAGDLGVADHLALAVTDELVVGGERDPRSLAARLWPLDELGRRYQDFVDRWSPVLPRLESMERAGEPLPDSAFLPGALAMGVAYRGCFERDPLLPAELLPQPWPGREARDLLVASRRLALRIRAVRGRPPLFAAYDDLVDAVPATPRDSGRGIGGRGPGSRGENAEGGTA
ncbi:MAG TPA: PaaX family transcriptional regulator C-terminal domain-containing protein [Acidimicrobiales bacterium]